MCDVDKSDRQYVRSCHLRKLQEKGATRAVAPASDKKKGVLDLRRMLNGVLQRCVSGGSVGLLVEVHIAAWGEAWDHSMFFVCLSLGLLDQQG